MKAVILAGGRGTRLSEETDLIPKPMVRIGNIPILQHIINYYYRFGHTDFVVALVSRHRAPTWLAAALVGLVALSRAVVSHRARCLERSG